MYPGKQSSAKKGHKALVRVAPPDEYSIAHTNACGIPDRDTVGHVFGGQPGPTGKPLGPKLLHPNQTDTYDREITVCEHFQRLRYQMRNGIGVHSKVQKNPSADDTF